MRCYFLVLDLLGFSSLVSNLHPNELHQRIENWVDLVERVMNDNGVTDIQLISDTVFVKEQDSSEGLERLLGFARALLEHGIQQSFPIRGAITHGDVHWGRLTFGKPVIEAHRLGNVPGLDRHLVCCTSATSGKLLELGPSSCISRAPQDRLNFPRACRCVEHSRFARPRCQDDFQWTI